MDNISKPETDGWIGKYGEGHPLCNTFKSYQRDEYNTATALCKNKRTAIGLGGNVRMMAYRMCEDFNEVHSFEPLFSKHIIENTKAFDNITVHPFAVGDKKQTVTMRKGIHHSGSSNIVKEKSADIPDDAYVDVDVVLVDDYNIKDVDFLKIDVEDYEYYALLGAIETIKKYKPIILIEMHDNNPNKTEIFHLLDTLDYIGKEAFFAKNTDWIFKHK